MPSSLKTFPDLGLEVDIPVTDLSGFARTSRDSHYYEDIANLRHTCQEWGFFRIVNHGFHKPSSKMYSQPSKNYVPCRRRPNKDWPQMIQKKVTVAVPTLKPSAFTSYLYQNQWLICLEKYGHRTEIHSSGMFSSCAFMHLLILQIEN